MKDRVGWGKGWVGVKKFIFVIASLQSLGHFAMIFNDLNDALL